MDHITVDPAVSQTETQLVFEVRAATKPDEQSDGDGDRCQQRNSQQLVGQRNRGHAALSYLETASVC